MKKLTDHIEYVKGQPHHVRRSVAFGTAGGFAAFVGLIWISGSLATGAFHIQGATFADANTPTAVEAVAPSDSGVAGVAAALAAPKAAHIEIIDTSSTTAPSEKPEPTVIPF